MMQIEHKKLLRAKQEVDIAWCKLIQAQLLLKEAERKLQQEKERQAK